MEIHKAMINVIITGQHHSGVIASVTATGYGTLSVV